MSRTRTEIVAHASKVLGDFQVLNELCGELAKIDDLERTMAKVKKQHDEAKVLVTRIAELDEAVKAREAKVQSLEKKISKLRDQAGTMAKR
jgi:predicted nuclease with TOPRIM domain